MLRHTRKVIRTIAQPIEKIDRLTERPVTSMLNHAKAATEQQLRQTDLGRGMVAGSKFLSDAARNYSQYRRSYKRYHGTVKVKISISRKPIRFVKVPGIKQQYNIRLEKQSVKRLRSQRKAVLQREKVAYHQAIGNTIKSFSNSGPVVQNFRKLHNLQRHSKAYRKYKKTYKKANHAEQQLLKDKKEIRRLSKPKSESGTMIVQSASQTIRNQALKDAGDNEFLQAGLKVAEIAARSGKVTRQQKLRRAQNREKRLKRQAGVQDQRLHRRESRLQAAKQPPPTFQQARRQTKQSIANTAKDIGRCIGRGVRDIAGKAVVPLVLIAFCGILLIAPLIGLFQIVEGSMFMIGTYNALDDDLSEAEAYYTKLAYDTNDRLIRCGGEYTWKSALQEFGVDTTGYKKPAKFVFLPSDYDFDVWKFWSYLCAYLYTEPEDEEAAEETDEPSEDAGMEMWKFDDQAKQAIELLFKHQYEFTHSYSGSGRWVLNETYTISDYMHYTSSNKVNDAAGQVYGLFVFDFKPTGLEAFCEDRGDGTYWIVYSLENLEIRNLNEKDAEGHYTATGWYFKNQLAGLSDSKGNNFPAFYTIGSGLYSTSVSEGYGFFLKVNGKDYWFPRSVTQSAADIAPNDALYFEYQLQPWFQTSLQNMTAGTTNPNTTDWGRSIFYQNVLSNAQGFGYNGHGYCQYFQMYQWDSQSSLSYGIKQKYTFDQAIENILTGIDADLYSYYLILSGGTQTSTGTSIQLYGGHQSISSPVGQNVTALAAGNYFLHDYGYDMQGWGTMHCGIAMTHQQHNGVDIVQNAGSPVYAMFGGEITALEDGLIVISATEKEHQVHLWLNQEETIRARANYSYIQPLSELSEGNIVTEGQLIGYTTGQKQCITDGGALSFNTIWSTNGGSDYLHVTVELRDSLLSDWYYIDPRLLISR